MWQPAPAPARRPARTAAGLGAAREQAGPVGRLTICRVSSTCCCRLGGTGLHGDRQACCRARLVLVKALLISSGEDSSCRAASLSSAVLGATLLEAQCPRCSSWLSGGLWAGLRPGTWPCRLFGSSCPESKPLLGRLGSRGDCAALLVGLPAAVQPLCCAGSLQPPCSMLEVAFSCW